MKSNSKQAFSHNVKAEVAAGKPVKQAVAIAYSEKGEKHMDEGGEVKDHDHEELMDHVALEVMHALDAKDKQGFIDGMQVMLADMLNKLCMDDDEDME